MSIKLQCSGCGKKLTTKNEFAGKRVKCPGCGLVILVTALPASQPIPELPPKDPLQVKPAVLQKSDVQDTNQSQHPDAPSVQVWLRDALNSAEQDGVALYLNDRDRASAWYSQQGLPGHDYTSEVGLNVNKYLADDCAEKSVHDEAWACFHRVLAGCAVQEKRSASPEALWRLGEAHVALGNYQLANLYLQAAEVMLIKHPEKDVQLRVKIERVILTALTRAPSALNTDGEALLTFLSTSKSSTLEDVAKTLFNRAATNAQWEKPKGVKIPSCQRHAAGQYLVSIWMNKKVGHRRAIACMLVNLGNIWVTLADQGNAEECWHELEQYIAEVANDPNFERFKADLKKLQSAPGHTERASIPKKSEYAGSKTCGQCGQEVHVLAHACPTCGGQVTLVASIPQDELPGILSKQSEARALVDQSMPLMQQGRFAEAETILRRAQEINPYNACAFGNMGGVFFLQEKFAEAIPWLEKALSLDPTLEGIPGHLATAKQNTRHTKVAGSDKKWWQFWK
jgi:tetratricopeptide (TPR) repeat protein/DNA-directed RNA polymerase subunit RPC12/RpoP